MSKFGDCSEQVAPSGHAAQDLSVETQDLFEPLSTSRNRLGAADLSNEIPENAGKCSPTSDHGLMLLLHNHAFRRTDFFGDDAKRTASELQNGVPSRERLSSIRARLVDRGVDDRELSSFVQDINAALEKNGSAYRVVTEPKDIANSSRVELKLVGRDGKSVPITEVDRKECREQRRAENVVDILARGPLDRRDRAEIENAFKEAYAEGGLGAVDNLKKKINSILEDDKSDIRLDEETPSLKSIFDPRRFDQVNLKTGHRQVVVDFDFEDPVLPLPQRDNMELWNFVR